MAKQIKKVAGKAAGKSTSKTGKKASKKVTRKAKQISPVKAVKKVSKKAANKIPKKAVKKAVSKKTGKRFLIIYHAPVDALAQTANSSPEEMAKGMAMWKAWAKRAGNKIADLGAPLINGTRLHANGSFLPSTRDVAGYSLLDAENWEELMSLLEGHPHISGWDPEATIEIHETMLIPGM
jgi:hypothetical protein